MPRTPNDSALTIALKVSVALPLAAAEAPIPVAAYAFARSGQLIAKRIIDTQGHVQLHLPDLKVAHEVRVMLGPDSEKDRAEVSELLRRGALEQVVRVGPSVEAPTLRFEVKGELYFDWMRSHLVRGRLVVANQASTVSEPRVQIWEIEPPELTISRLPDAVVADFAGLVNEVAARTLTVRAPGALEMRSPVRTARIYARNLPIGEQLLSLQRSPRFSALVRLTEHPAPLLRAELVAQAGSLTQLLYLLYPAWIRKHLLANIGVGDDGGFETRVFPSRGYRRLNLYFTASATVRGLSLPIYDPKPVAGAIYWDYQSGSEIVLDAAAAQGVLHASSPAHTVAGVTARGSASVASAPRYRSA